MSLKVNKAGVEFPPLEDVEIKRGDDKGKKYFAPINWKLQDLINFYNGEDGDEGIKLVTEILITKWRQYCQGWSAEATDKNTGTFDEAAFLSMFAKCSARGESVKDIIEKMKDAALAISELEPLWTTDPVGAAKEARRLSGVIKSLKLDLDAKRNKTPEDLAVEAATPATT